tara:strand:+ start:498 stop:731 length:234 start_codon:yes stop_codon:yes gene_type:complete
MRNTQADNILNKVVKSFAETRKAKGISHEKLAEKAGITRPAISHIESGRRKPSLLVCIKIAKALDLKLWEVIKKAEK